MVSAKSKSEFTILKMSPGTLKIKTTPTKKNLILYVFELFRKGPWISNSHDFQILMNFK